MLEASAVGGLRSLRLRICLCLDDLENAKTKRNYIELEMGDLAKALAESSISKKNQRSAQDDGQDLSEDGGAEDLESTPYSMRKNNAARNFYLDKFIYLRLK
jgi:hypothetical protein